MRTHNRNFKFTLPGLLPGLLPCSTPLLTPLVYSLALLPCSTPLVYSIALLPCSTPLLYSLALLPCSTLLLYSLALLPCFTPLLYRDLASCQGMPCRVAWSRLLRAAPPATVCYCVVWRTGPVSESTDCPSVHVRAGTLPPGTASLPAMRLSLTLNEGQFIKNPQFLL